MMGKRSGFVALVKDKCPNIIVTHCVLHRHALATKTLPKELSDVMTVVVNTVNFIRARALNHRLFRSSATTSALHIPISCTTLKCVGYPGAKLRLAIVIFMREKGNELTDYSATLFSS